MALQALVTLRASMGRSAMMTGARTCVKMLNPAVCQTTLPYGMTRMGPNPVEKREREREGGRVMRREKPPQRRLEGWLEGCCEWGDVTAPAPESLLQRPSERGEGKEEEGREGEAGARLLLEVEVLEVEVLEVEVLEVEVLLVRSALHRRALAPIHHLSACQASVWSVTAAAATPKKRRNWKNPFAPDVDKQTAGPPDDIRNA
ncbi:hypothetical protein PAMP_005679 [Pampus punctatissimus]